MMVPRLVPPDMPPESDKYRKLHGLNVSIRLPEIEPKNIRPNLEPNTYMKDSLGGEFL